MRKPLGQQRPPRQEPILCKGRPRPVVYKGKMTFSGVISFFAGLTIGIKLAV